MSKLYVGNLPADVNEGTLRQLFQDHNLPCTMVLVKRGGYAFVDCPDQTTADRAIDKLNGYNFLGSSLVVEPSVAGGGAKRSGAPRVLLSGVPSHVSQEELEPLLSNVGPVAQWERLPPRDGTNGHAYIVTFENSDHAQLAINQLNGYEYEGASLRADWASDRRSRSRSARPAPPFSGIPGGARQMDFPLRILVQSDMVGAIIGRQGSTIRQITQQTRARVDVHRKDNVGSLEKAITIYGNPENCSNACKRILEVMQQEASSTNKGEISLKMLAHNNLIGRIIGKGGNTIKRIMQDTETKITVSSINDISSFNLERIITIKGGIEGMAKAESLISGKLKQSYESDLQAMAPQSLMFPGLHPMAMMSTLGMGFSRGAGFSGMYGSGPSPYPPMYPPAMPSQPGGQAVTQGYSHEEQEDTEANETTFLYIPNTAVGAIIGKKGSHIRNIIRFSGASVKISPLEQDVKPSQEPSPSQQPQPPLQQTPQERKVTVVGTPEAQWKAQYLLFEKMREEGFVSGSEDVRLTVEILVPSSQVGRIIGKGGQNVRELQRVTGSVIKLPEQGAAAVSGQEETTVQILGPFFSVQSAQRRIRAMVAQSQPAGSRGPRPPRRPEQQ